jgi:hypothetical protein
MGSYILEKPDLPGLSIRPLPVNSLHGLLAGHDQGLGLQGIQGIQGLQGIAGTQTQASSDSNNYLVIELLHIINQIPAGLGWAAWLATFLWHCCIVTSINFLIKHFDSKFLTKVYDVLLGLGLQCLPFLGFHVKKYKADVLYGTNSRDPNSIFHEKLTKFFQIEDPYSFNSYFYYPEPPNGINLPMAKSRVLLKYWNDRGRVPAILYASSYSDKGKQSFGTHIDFTLYYWYPETVDYVEKIDCSINSQDRKDQAFFSTYDFKNNSLNMQTIVSNPLIPIKNYQKLDEIIKQFTKIQNCLGYKNVNAISIDGPPGLGKTSFMDYFSQKHGEDYVIVYIDMIKNYKIGFDVIFSNIQQKLEEASKTIYLDETIMSGKVGIVIMIDEIDKYLDMHLEYLHHKKDEKKAEATPDLINKKLENIINGEMFTKKYALKTKTKTDVDVEAEIKPKYPLNNIYDNHRDEPEDLTFSDVRITGDEDLTRDARFLKKELLYKLFELINMKVNQPSYLIFCTNKFSSMWSDLSEKHYNHLKALHNRFIKIHFEHINKENLTEILADINQTFGKKLQTHYLSEDKFIELTNSLPDNLCLTVREMHHTLIRTMYNIEEFIKIICNNDNDTDTLTVKETFNQVKTDNFLSVVDPRKNTGTDTVTVTDTDTVLDTEAVTLGSSHGFVQDFDESVARGIFNGSGHGQVVSRQHDSGQHDSGQHDNRRHDSRRHDSRRHDNRRHDSRRHDSRRHDSIWEHDISCQPENRLLNLLPTQEFYTDFNPEMEGNTQPLHEVPWHFQYTIPVLPPIAPGRKGECGKNEPGHNQH